MALHLHRSESRAPGSSFAFAVGRPIPGAASQTTMAVGQTRVLWGCDPTRAKSLASRSDSKWEGDSEVEGIGRN